MSKEKKIKFISLLNDTTFKYMLKNERMRPWFNKLIYYVTGIDISEYKLIDQELNSGNDIKDYRLDILLEKDNQLINIEMNKYLNEYTLIKNHTYLYRLAGSGYLSGDKFSKKYVTQINFNNSYCPENKDVGVLCYEFQNKEIDSKIEGIKDYEIYLESFRGICYNGDNEKEMMLSMFMGDDYDGLRKIASENKEAKEVIEELERLGIDDKWNAWYDNSIIQKKIENSARSYGYDEGYDAGVLKGKEAGILEGKRSNSIEIAKNLINQNINIEDISKSTGLTIEEIENLK